MGKDKKNKSLQELTAEIMDQFIQHLSKYKERVIEKIASELKMKVSQLKNIQIKMSNVQGNASPKKEKDYRRRF